MDLFVANDTVQNFLFVNRGPGADGRWKWDEIALQSGVGFSANGRTRSGMGVDAADLDGDGWQDLFVANVDHEMYSVYMNNKDESFHDASEKLVVEQTDSGIHMQELKGNETKADYECKLDGKDCEFKEDGHPAKVSLWFNGPKLVELVTRGRNIVRRRFTLADGGKKLVVEMSAFSNPDKSETVEYTRQ